MPKRPNLHKRLLAAEVLEEQAERAGEIVARVEGMGDTRPQLQEMRARVLDLREVISYLRN